MATEANDVHDKMTTLREQEPKADIRYINIYVNGSEIGFDNIPLEDTRTIFHYLLCKDRNYPSNIPLQRLFGSRGMHVWHKHVQRELLSAL